MTRIHGALLATATVAVALTVGQGGGAKPGLGFSRARAAAAAAAPAAAESKKTPRLSNGHPDLSGVWAARSMQFKTTSKNGSVDITYPTGVAKPRTGPDPDAPKYKPQYQAQVADLGKRQDFVDKVFVCGRPGVPRLGAPAKIMQTPAEAVLLYQYYPVGDFFRVVPTDGTGYNEDLEPTYNGDAVGHWEGDTLVVVSKNFVTDTWFGEDGWIHGPNMTVTERFRRQGDALFYQVTVDDPDMLSEPWKKKEQELTLSHDRVLESPPCMDTSRPILSNDDHH